MRASEFPVLERVAGTIFRYNMLRAGDRVGVAVSGGADSVCLLHLLPLVAPSHPLTVVHLNHCLRGAESDADQAFVEDLARSLGYPCVTERANVQGRRGNLEAAAREARRNLFRRLIASGGVDVVATGHTLDDQAETVLFRLMRGSGVTGLRGIRGATGDGIIRPLLEVRRDEVRKWLKERHLCWREDRTNADPQFTRNRIRRDLLPQLEREFNPRLRSVLASTAQVADAEEDYWQAVVADAAARVFVAAPGSMTAEAAQLASLPVALARRLVRAAAADASGGYTALNFEQTEAALELCRRSRGHGTLQAPGATVTRSLDWVRFAGLGAAKHEYIRDLPVPGDAETTDGIRIRAELASFRHAYNVGGGVCDAAKLPQSLVLRNWRPGDRFEANPGRFRKVKDLFQQARVPVWDRDGWPVVTSGDTVIWLQQFGIAAAFAPGPDTRTIVTFSQQPNRIPAESRPIC